MGVHYPSEPDFNSEPEEEDPSHARRRQLLIYAGVTLSLLALLVILFLNM